MPSAMPRQILLGMIMLFLGCLPTVGAEPLSVFVSIVPQEVFVSRIGGEHVRVQALVKPGQDPHAFEPTGRQIAALAGADLYIRTGVGFEDAWMPRLLAANPDLRVLDAREGIELHATEMDDDHDHDGHHHGEVDPHIWTSPARVKRMGARIRDLLIELDPAHAADFASGFERFAADLDQLDQAIRQRLSGSTNRRFMVYHPAWGYFADDYGLEQIAIEQAGKDPSARALVALIEQARRQGVRVILVQPQSNPAAAERVAREIGGRVAIVDPLSSRYFETLLQLADLIAGESAP